MLRARSFHRSHLGVLAFSLAACGAPQGDAPVPSASGLAPSDSAPVASASIAPTAMATARAELASTGAGVVDLARPTAPPQPPRLDEAPAGMLWVPGGRFVMGCDDQGEPDEHPAHEVTVASFWLDATEVTNAAYSECVEASACRPHSPLNAAHNGYDDRSFRRPNQPVSGVSWDDASAYCHRLGKRLPTEAEWERAARGDDGRRYPWGNEPPDPERAVFGTGATSDVGSHPLGRGPYGHLDLAGNVWEWIADEYDPYAYRRVTAAEGKPGSCPEILTALAELRRTHRDGFTGSNPIPTECEHVLRGGAFNYSRTGLRATNRVHHPGRFRLVMSGFRCAKDR
jgi:formylglycine-generating enzyme required for sulfatase activity